jgi:hypothetical protein
LPVNDAAVTFAERPADAMGSFSAGRVSKEEK